MKAPKRIRREASSLSSRFSSQASRKSSSMFPRSQARSFAPFVYFASAARLRSAIVLTSLRSRSFHCSSERVSSPPIGVARSEEHTSELQSRENLVCRLLLEKQK